MEVSIETSMVCGTKTKGTYMIWTLVFFSFWFFRWKQNSSRYSFDRNSDFNRNFVWKAAEFTSFYMFCDGLISHNPTMYRVGLLGLLLNLLVIQLYQIISRVSYFKNLMHNAMWAEFWPDFCSHCEYNSAQKNLQMPNIILLFWSENFRKLLNFSALSITQQ